MVVSTFSVWLFISLDPFFARYFIATVARCSDNQTCTLQNTGNNNRQNACTSRIAHKYTCILNRRQLHKQRSTNIQKYSPLLSLPSLQKRNAHSYVILFTLSVCYSTFWRRLPKTKAKKRNNIRGNELSPWAQKIRAHGCWLLCRDEMSDSY